MFRRSVLIVAFLFCAPVLWAALVDGSVTLESAGIRFLIALPVAGILVGLVRYASTHRAPASAEDPTEQHAHRP